MEVILSRSAEKQYKSLPKTEQKKVHKKMSVLENDPTIGKKLVGEFEGIYSVKAWPYRILYEINKSTNRIEIHKIVHRQSAYK
jgi:mRNA-degrading endonuclease RelE of RelBE toxin-antitoxin system